MKNLIKRVRHLQSELSLTWDNRANLWAEVEFNVREYIASGEIQDWGKALTMPWSRKEQFRPLEMQVVTLIATEITWLQMKRLARGERLFSKLQTFWLSMLLQPLVRTYVYWPEIKVMKKDYSQARAIELYESEMSTISKEDAEVFSEVSARLIERLHGEEAAQEFLEGMDQVCDVCGGVDGLPSFIHRHDCTSPDAKSKVRSDFPYSAVSEPTLPHIRVVDQSSDDTTPYNEESFQFHLELIYGTAMSPEFPYAEVWGTLRETFHTITPETFKRILEVAADLAEVRSSDAFIVKHDFLQAIRLVAAEVDEAEEQSELEYKESLRKTVPGLGYPTGLNYE